ncbi:MAG: nuclear transport factor 2 family protein [Acidobacteria bacterium]|nr:nuclear transport factor 2 family protein [Acidobacteriota bacterium]
MLKTFKRLMACGVAAMLLAAGSVSTAGAQKKSAKESRAITENQELDRQFVDAYVGMDLDRLMNLYWRHDELASIGPDGSVARGWEKVRAGYQDFFSGMQSLDMDLGESNYVVSGDGVLGFGNASVRMQPKSGPVVNATLCYSDYRKKVGGHWVYVFDHVQMVVPASSSSASDTLYKRLGGYDAIAAVTDDFIPRLATDPQLKPFFSGSSTDSLKRIRQLVVDQLCAATGGPCVYIGRSMKASHEGLGITSRDWDLAVNHLVATLNKFNVPAKEQGEIASALGQLKDDVVDKK